MSFPRITWAQLSKVAASAQQAQAPPEEPAQDPLKRTTPRGTVLGFLGAAYAHKDEIAVQYLETHAQGAEAATLAQQLFFVLDRRLPAKLNNVSDQPLGSLSDVADSTRELIGTVVSAHGGVDIYLKRVELPDGVFVWLFSRETLAGIPDLYQEINAARKVEDLVPDFLLRKIFGVTLFGWAYFLIFLPLLYLALSVVNRVVSAASGYAIRRWTGRVKARNPTILPHPARLLVLSFTIYATVHEISLSLLARQGGSTIALMILIVAFVWTMFLVNAKSESYLKRRMEKQGRLSATAVLRPARRVMDFIAILIGFMFVLHKLGINPSTTLAGLGVGGIAIALAAQKTLENVIGGASLIMDGALRVGDFFKMGDVMGTIEVIGLRSTRVRTLDRTVVNIPNGQMATMTLENFSARDQFWLRQVIAVEHKTHESCLNALLAEIRSMLEHDPRIIPATTRVRLLRLGESNLEVEVFAYASAQDWNHFLAIQEEILMRIREAIQGTGVGLGYPGRAIYVKDGNDVRGLADGPLRKAAFAQKELIHEVPKK